MSVATLDRRMRLVRNLRIAARTAEETGATSVQIWFDQNAGVAVMEAPPKAVRLLADELERRWTS